jgi:hypothetical protein
MFPVLIVPFAALLWWSASFSGDVHRSDFDPITLAGAFGLIALLALACTSWWIWTTRVTVGERWIEWKRGTEYRSMGWEQISALGTRHTLGGIRVGLVEHATGLLHPLPLMTPELYKILSERYGRLPADAEADVLG